MLTAIGGFILYLYIEFMIWAHGLTKAESSMVWLQIEQLLDHYHENTDRLDRARELAKFVFWYGYKGWH